MIYFKLFNLINILISVNCSIKKNIKNNLLDISILNLFLNFQNDNNIFNDLNNYDKNLNEETFIQFINKYNLFISKEKVFDLKKYFKMTSAKDLQ